MIDKALEKVPTDNVFKVAAAVCLGVLALIVWEGVEKTRNHAASLQSELKDGRDRAAAIEKMIYTEVKDPKTRSQQLQELHNQFEEERTLAIQRHDAAATETSWLRLFVGVAYGSAGMFFLALWHLKTERRSDRLALLEIVAKQLANEKTKLEIEQLRAAVAVGKQSPPASGHDDATP